MASVDKAGTFTLGSRTVKRLGYGAMQLAGPGVFGPPRDHDAALAVLREVVSSGVNQSIPATIRPPYHQPLIARRCIPTPTIWFRHQIGELRGDDDRGCRPSPRGATQAEHENLRNLGVDMLMSSISGAL